MIMFEKSLNYAVKKVRDNLDEFVENYPHVSEKCVYKGYPNNLWTCSFYPGMCFLAYEITGEKEFVKHVEEYLRDFENRIDRRIGISHDLGFLFTLTAAASYKVLGSEYGRRLMEKAAVLLAGRYNEKGKYIQAWGDIGTGEPEVRIIIDTMMNLPLLYLSGNKEYFEMAREHARTAGRTLIRKDYSSYHVYYMNPVTGEAIRGGTHQGFRDESTWARGQAWAVYGYVLSYRYTREPAFLDIAKKTAKVFIRNLPADLVPYWDFSFTDDNPDIKDTSAAAIYVCGLLELSKYVSVHEAEEYRELAIKIMKSLEDSYLTSDITGSNGILKEGMYHRTNGARECTIWGDYFFMEALVRMNSDWRLYW